MMIACRVRRTRRAKKIKSGVILEFVSSESTAMSVIRAFCSSRNCQFQAANFVVMVRGTHAHIHRKSSSQIGCDNSKASGGESAINGAVPYRTEANAERKTTGRLNTNS